MKIGLVLSKSPAYSETFFINKIKGLQSAGYEVVLFVQAHSKSFDLCQTVQAPRIYKRAWIQFFMNIWVFVMLLPNYKRLFLFIQLEKEAKRSHTQILKNIYNNAHLLKANVDWLHFGFGTLVLQSEHVAKVIRAKMAVSFRGFDISIYPIKHPNCFDLLWQNVDKVHVISNDILDLVFKNGLKKNTEYQIITPAINIKLFKRNYLPFKQSTSTMRFLTIARLHWKKGLIETLEALAILKAKGILFQYIIVGSGQEYEPLRFAIYQLDLEKEVQLVGQQAHENIKGYMEDADMYLQYSISEGFCNAVLEAQAMGLLCVVSDAEGLQENVLHKQTGFVVPKRQPKLLANAIEQLIQLPLEQKQAMRTNAQERVEQVFNLGNQQAAFVAFYKH